MTARKKKKFRPRKLQAVLIKDVTIPEDFSIRKQGLTQSLLGAYQTCPLRFLLLINRWVKPDGDSVFEFGNIYHDALDQSYQNKKAPSNPVLKGRLKRYAKKRVLELSDVALLVFDKQLALSEMILQEYYKWYSDDFKKIKIIKPEQLFNVSFYEWRLRGKKDLRFVWRGKSKDVWLKEHKTKGRIEADILEDVLNFDLQNLFYITADDLEYKQDASNVLYNIIRNPGHKQKKDEAFTQYLERIRKHIQDDPNHFFIRYECPYTQPNKKRFKDELYYKCEQIDKFLNGEIPVWRNELACKIPYRCQYLDACASGKLAGYIQQKTQFPELES